jgi:hypothetical protein
MRDRNQAVQQIVPPPVTTDKDADDDPSMLPVSDDVSLQLRFRIRGRYLGQSI